MGAPHQRACHLAPLPQLLVNFGSSWCHHCHQMFPAFLKLSKQFPQLKYALAQVGAAAAARQTAVPGSWAAGLRSRPPPCPAAAGPRWAA